jgi:hypothetical protein
MKTELQWAPWYQGRITTETKDALDLLEGTWREAAIRYATIKSIRAADGRNEPKGIQTFLNQVIDERFKAARWDGAEGRFRRSNTWVRVTFRHQMGLGSDFLDATRLAALEGVKQCVLLGAPLQFLKIISPRDANALSSYEKIVFQAAQLNGAVSPPLIVGSLQPFSKLPKNVQEVVFGSR